MRPHKKLMQTSSLKRKFPTKEVSERGNFLSKRFSKFSAQKVHWQRSFGTKRKLSNEQVLKQRNSLTRKFSDEVLQRRSSQTREFSDEDVICQESLQTRKFWNKEFLEQESSKTRKFYNKKSVTWTFFKRKLSNKEVHWRNFFSIQLRAKFYH